MTLPIYQRMIEKVVPVTETGCWLFAGSWDGGGYGQVSTEKGKAPAKAHRVSFEHHHGDIPEGLHVCHRCDTPCCVNPHHLFAGTATDNMQDCFSKGRNNLLSLANLQPGAPGHHGASPKKVSN